MSIIRRSVSNLARSLTEGTPLFKSRIELCVPEIVLTPSLASMQVRITQLLGPYLPTFRSNLNSSLRMRSHLKRSLSNSIHEILF